MVAAQLPTEISRILEAIRHFPKAIYRTERGSAGSSLPPRLFVEVDPALPRSALCKRSFASPGGGEVLVEEFGAGFEEVVGGDDAD